ncbi:CPBP family intramembrane glutamic endopeptidase [Parenemella sanctibonifatiensis]|uniref:CPBP family intramembrane glutamic endopeptidase n=1 Tax=Parenemella sanctibonifatiensis TaxID=2016505 RepID=UPI0015C5D9A8|nr:CPBP family intramembrane glutamic endopeptidase [Parenemella sanctibonifatiensis]
MNQPNLGAPQPDPTPAGPTPAQPGPAQPAPAQPGQQPAYAPSRGPQKPSPLPTEPQDFLRFYRSPRWAAWRGILLVITLGVGFFAILNVVVSIGIAIDLVTGRVDADSLGQTTPMLFAFNHLGSALCLPATLLLHWAWTGQRPKWLSSVAGGFRWGRVLRALVVALPLWIIYTLLTSLFPAAGGAGMESVEIGVHADTWFLLAVVVLVTPFQAAAEEYLFRGAGARAIGSLGPNRLVASIIAVVITSLLFCLAHGASDPWLWAYYFLFGVLMSVATWLTGGLELAVVMHAVNNLVSLAALPFLPELTEVFDRSAGTGSPLLVLPLVCGAITTAIVVWWQRRAGVQTSVPEVGAPATA